MNMEMLRKIEASGNDGSLILPQAQMAAIVESYLDAREKYLNLYRQYRKPLYVLESEILRRKAAEFKRAFSTYFDNPGCFFAMKCNNHPSLTGILAECGFGIDVSSGLELEAALRSGAREIVFSGPGKTEEEIAAAVRNRDRLTILADSSGELEKINRAALAAGVTIRTGIRLASDARWRKFGIALEKLEECRQMLKRLPGVDFRGLQFHTSWNLTPDAQVEFIHKLGDCLRNMPEDFRKSIQFLDIGGGYWPEQGEWLRRQAIPQGKLEELAGMGDIRPLEYYFRPAKPIVHFAEQISIAVKKHIFPLLSCRICCEPGRWICNDAVQMLFTVGDKKSGDLVITDAGTNAVGWERFEQDYFPLINLSSPAAEEHACEVLGSLCTPHDVWGYSYWGSSINEGDVLLIPMQGAYTYSLRQNFIKPLPEFVCI